MRNTAHLGQVGVDDAGGQRNERAGAPMDLDVAAEPGTGTGRGRPPTRRVCGRGEALRGLDVEVGVPTFALCVNLGARKRTPVVARNTRPI